MSEQGLHNAAMLTVADVQRLVPVSRDSIYRAISRGDLPAYKPCGRIMVRRADLDEWIEQSRVTARRRELPTEPVPLAPGRRGGLRARRKDAA